MIYAINSKPISLAEVVLPVGRRCSQAGMKAERRIRLLFGILHATYSAKFLGLNWCHSLASHQISSHIKGLRIKIVVRQLLLFQFVAMTYSVLLLGATGLIGKKIASQLSNHKSSLGRVAFLTPTTDGGPDKEEKYSNVPLDRIVGSLDASESYHGGTYLLLFLFFLLTREQALISSSLQLEKRCVCINQSISTLLLRLA